MTKTFSMKTLQTYWNHKNPMLRARDPHLNLHAFHHHYPPNLVSPIWKLPISHKPQKNPLRKKTQKKPKSDLDLPPHGVLQID
ncbi:Hypothetical protein CINCED_3A001289 [Cinara cedri]|uniref:Uncharacterized protein n=1 Tax=Cinara cedri TaxID=506608 RepID=A0A5E4NL15_9HEMI|nr:Hypothetical protein CINCED_3A001289 [Cinara cedri]